jgi:hypothetical protein
MTSRTNTENPTLRPKLRIWQQNLNKSFFAQSHLLHSIRPDTYDILVIQEPYLDRLGNTRDNSQWRVHYPDQHETARQKTRSVILINKSIPTGSWSPIRIDSNDITGILVKGQDFDIAIYNIYNDCTHSENITAARGALTHLTNSRPERPTYTLLLGDFNRHHPAWDDPANSHLFTRENLRKAQMVLDLAADFSLTMALPPKIPTLEALSSGRYTRVDNVFISDDIAHLVTKCKTSPKRRPIKTDHIPIITHLECSIVRNRILSSRVMGIPRSWEFPFGVNRAK